MPFAHCTDCGAPALIDPSGRCPEGHEVGHAGARVAAGIGTSVPHPDEPKPWVGVVDIDPILIDSQPPQPRVALPPSLPASRDTTPAAATEAVAPAAESSDDLLRVLHDLGDLGGLGSDGPAVAPPRPTPAPASQDPVPPVPPANLAVTPGSPAPPSSPEEATGLDELASLAAAIGSLDDRDASAARPVSPPPTAHPVAAPAPTPSASMLDELWVAAEPSPPMPPAAAAPPAPAAPPAHAMPPPAPAPTVTSFGAALPPAPVPVAAPPGPPPTADAANSPFDGSFTARGVGRRTQRRLDEKAAKKGLFRR
ncbi:hypothetical protein [Nitriliruptor alkaliphilus]|uniref:hypothetical protein n=1 Tax=Nitriliruptor alkaliphilus TaxID=427918 RepID=UPI000697A2EA|nr:hypothetical protein [Nitriliruptor alkaliphilus]